MKRLGNIWPTFCTVENAVQAIYQGTANKRDDKNVAAAFFYSESEVAANPDLYRKINPQRAEIYAKRLVVKLSAGTWQPHRPYKMRRWCRAHNALGGKWRYIDCAALEDHIVQWMLILAIMPALKRGMYKHTCGSVPKRGPEHVRKYVERWVRNDKQSAFFVKLDIRKFFPSIEHALMMDCLKRVIKDERILRLCLQIIQSTGETGKGIAVGFFSSPWFGNLLLQSLDYYIMQQLFKLRRGKRIPYVTHLVRYVDDILLLGSSKRDLDKAVRAIRGKLHSDYHLDIKSTWEVKAIAEHVTDEQGHWRLKPGTAWVDICGYKFSREATILRDSLFLSTTRKARRICRIKAETNTIRDADASALLSKVGWAKRVQNRRFYQKHIDPYVDMQELKGVISDAAKRRVRHAPRAVHS